MIYALGAAVVLASYWLGGWYWCLLYAVVAVAQWRIPPRMMAAVLVPLVWVALFAVTGDRRLFFPFALYQAITFGLAWRGGFALGAAFIVALFTLIRIEQEASLRVIAVELIVAVVAVLVGGACRRYGVIAAASAASLVALAGLLL